MRLTQKLPRPLALLAVALMVLGLSACQKGTIRTYAMEVVVEDHGQIRTGRTVRRSRYVPRLKWMGSMDTGKDYMWAEAVVIPTSVNRLLLIGFRSSDSSGVWTRNGKDYQILSVPREGEAAVPLVIPPDQWPAMYTFTDPADPTTVRVLTLDNFAEVMGPDIEVRSISLISVDEEPSDILKTYLPWIVADDGGMFLGSEGPMNMNGQDPPRIPEQDTSKADLYSRDK